MTVNVYTKKSFIDWLERNLDENDAIIFSNVIQGELKHLSKTNTLRIPFLYPAQAFKVPMRDISQGGIKPLSFAVCKSDSVTGNAKVLFDAVRNAGQ